VKGLPLDADSQKVRRNVLVNLQAARFPNSQTGGTAPDEHHPILLHRPMSQSRHNLAREARVFCFVFLTTRIVINSWFHFRGLLFSFQLVRSFSGVMFSDVVGAEVATSLACGEGGK
jgi:hypothetical protein